MATATLSLSKPPNHHRHLSFTNYTHHHHHFLTFPKTKNYNHLPSIKTHNSSSFQTLENPLQSTLFLTPQELKNLDSLSNYSYHTELKSGFLWVRVMRQEEIDMTVTLLAESFAESMLMGKGYAKLLEFLVKNYLIERREMMPHTATLLGVYREEGEEEFELAGTVEISFDKRGANVNPPTPTPPKDSAYICNMAVRNHLRRRGIGWHLLKAGEELISQVSSSRDVYLHCRIIDEGPFNMYKKAGYTVVKTDSILTLLTLQRRRQLMRKDLPVPDDPDSVDIPNEELS